MLSTLLFGLVAPTASGQHFKLTPRDLLTGRYDSVAVANALLKPEEWRPYPTIDERAAWMALPEPVRTGHVAAAETLIGTSWPQLPATVFLEFVRTGNRSNYQNIRHERRAKLAALVMGEVFEDGGRFLDDIVNGIWAISEETYWGLPAHLDIQSAGYGLPDVDEPTVDLFAAETASLFAWTLYLLGDRLDQVSPLVTPRIRSELKRRVLDPNLEREDFWWMAFEPSVINNWTPWVNSNWLTTVLIAEEDPERRSAAVYKIMRSVDVFINSYPDDGGCDEGPVYWTRAGGSLLEVLELLRSGTQGLVDIYDEPLVAEMGRYVVRGHIAGNYFINFADAGPRLTPPAALVYLYGKRIDDAALVQFGAAAARRQQLGSQAIPGRFGHLPRQLLTMFLLDEMEQVTESGATLLDVWLPDTGVMAARSSADEAAGLFVAAKGGHNEENHNHNDVGNFMIYIDGEPAVIDLGPGTYTRTTFSDDRYTIWNFQSGYHNVPTINGSDQPPGAAYRATDLAYNATAETVEFSQELGTAYPEEAGVSSWRRTIRMDRPDTGRPSVEVSDIFEIATAGGATTLNLMTNRVVRQEDRGRIALEPRSGTGRTLLVEFDPSAIEPSVEEIELADETLVRNWGESVSRIVLALDVNGNSGPVAGDVSVRFSPRDPG